MNYFQKNTIVTKICQNSYCFDNRTVSLNGQFYPKPFTADYRVTTVSMISVNVKVDVNYSSEFKDRAENENSKNCELFWKTFVHVYELTRMPETWISALGV